MEPDQRDITTLLHHWQEGDRLAEARLFELVLPELHRIARGYMSHERKGHTLDATELVGEIYDRLVRAKDRCIKNRGHFFAIAARSMRWCLVDYARRRPFGSEVSLDFIDAMLPANSDIETAVLVSNVLDELADVKPEWCTAVELRYYLGLTDEQAAEVLNVSSRTVKRHWHDARRWLFERLSSNVAQLVE